MLARLFVSVIFNHFWKKKSERKCSFCVLHCAYKCIYVCMFYNSKKLIFFFKVILKLVTFSVDFADTWLIISKTTDHTQLLESQDYVLNS